jgi:hypothetical protein
MRKLAIVLVGQGAVIGAAVVAACGVDRGGGDPEQVAVAKGAASDSVTFAIDSNVPDEHCRMSGALQAIYVSGRQVRISADGGDAGAHLGLCTVDSIAHTVDGGAATVYLNSDYASKRLGLTSGTKSGTVSNEDGDGGIRVARARSFPDASINNDGIDASIFEYSRYQDGASVAYTAPHGRIETGTDQQVDRIVKSDTSSRNAAWAVRYDTTFNAGSLPDFNHFHITSSDINTTSFPDLGGIDGLDVPYAVSFHGFGATNHDIQDDGGILPGPNDAGCTINTAGETGNYYALVGGGEEEYFRRGIAELIEEFFYAGNVLPGKKALWRIPLLACTAETEDWGLRGTATANFVNRIARGDRGVQIEQFVDLRNSSIARETLADAVKSVYDCLLDNTNVAIDVATSPASVTEIGTAASYQQDSNKCPHYVAGVSSSTADAGLTFSIDAGASTAASCANGARAYVSIYQWNGAISRWDRIGGGRRIYTDPDGAGAQSCQVSDDSGYQAATSLSSSDLFRVVVRAVENTISSPAALSAQVTVTK